MFDTKRFMGAALVAGLFAALPAPALAKSGGDEFGPSFSQRCSDDWQYVGYAVIAYVDTPGLEAKEQLLQELVRGLRRAAREC